MPRRTIYPNVVLLSIAVNRRSCEQQHCAPDGGIGVHAGKGRKLQTWSRHPTVGGSVA